MKRISVYVFAIVIAGAASAIFATVAHHRSHVVLSDVSKQDASKQTDAAFRDGLFLARLDAEHGRKPHLASGRPVAHELDVVGRILDRGELRIAFEIER